MAWTSPRTWVAGEKPSAATMNTHIRDNFKAIGDAWTSYGSGASWTAVTSNPSLGNGTWAGRYFQVGKYVQGSIRIKMGSTTTFGSGAFLFALPVAALTTGDETVGWATITDTSASAHFSFGAWLNTSMTCGLSDSAAVNAKSTTPMTFANLDVITIGFSYEAA